MDKMEYVHMFEEEESHWWYIGMRTIVLSLLPPASLPANPRVLDAGCGTGFNLEWLEQNYNARVTGFDYAQLGLEFCRRRGGQSIARADAAAVPFFSGIFDLVVSFDVLTQLKDEAARNAALREFQRVLKPGGRLLLRVAAYEFLRSSHDEVIMTYHRFGRRELRDMATNAGLRPIRLTGANTLLFPAAAVWRILKKAGLAPAGSDVRSSTRGSSGLNRAMTNLLKLEAAILRRSNFPFGLSIFLLAEK
jgi:SAM-dependent methyltransferase